MLIQRIFSVFQGRKRVRLLISPRANHHFLVNSADLPGFSMMLLPGDIEDQKALSAALVPAMETFIAAQHWDSKRRVKVRLDRRRPSAHEINARWSAA